MHGEKCFSLALVFIQENREFEEVHWDTSSLAHHNSRQWLCKHQYVKSQCIALATKSSPAVVSSGSRGVSLNKRHTRRSMISINITAPNDLCISVACSFSAHWAWRQEKFPLQLKVSIKVVNLKWILFLG